MSVVGRTNVPPLPDCWTAGLAKNQLQEHDSGGGIGLTLPEGRYDRRPSEPCKWR